MGGSGPRTGMPWDWLALTGFSVDRPGGVPLQGGRSSGCVSGKKSANSDNAGAMAGCLLAFLRTLKETKFIRVPPGWSF